MRIKYYLISVLSLLLISGCSNSSDSYQPPNMSPIAAFTFSCEDLTCDFDASDSSDNDGSIVSYAWSFGGMGVTTSNTFESGGTYSVTLTVVDDEGASGSITQDVTVTDPPSNFTAFTKEQFAREANSEPVEINDTTFTDPDEENEGAYDDLLAE